MRKKKFGEGPDLAWQLANLERIAAEQDALQEQIRARQLAGRGMTLDQLMHSIFLDNLDANYRRLMGDDAPPPREEQS